MNTPQDYRKAKEMLSDSARKANQIIPLQDVIKILLWVTWDYIKTIVRLRYLRIRYK